MWTQLGAIMLMALFLIESGLGHAHTIKHHLTTGEYNLLEGDLNICRGNILVTPIDPDSGEFVLNGIYAFYLAAKTDNASHPDCTDTAEHFVNHEKDKLILAQVHSSDCPLPERPPGKASGDQRKKMSKITRSLEIEKNHLTLTTEYEDGRSYVCRWSKK